MLSSQILKGILEPSILKIISQKNTYGYEIVEKLNELGLDVLEGTVYPLLLRLEKKGFIVSERRKSEIGPIRKYLSITVSGEEEVKRFQKEWSYLKPIVDKIFSGVNL